MELTHADGSEIGSTITIILTQVFALHASAGVGDRSKLNARRNMCAPSSSEEVSRLVHLELALRAAR